MHRPLRWLVVLVTLLLTLGLTACEQERADTTLPTDPQVGEGEQVLTPGAEGTDNGGIVVGEEVTTTEGLTTTTPTTPTDGTTPVTDTTGVTTTTPVTTTPPLTGTTPTEATTVPSVEATTVTVPDGGTGDTPSDAATTQTYTVQAGDSLYSIAVATGTTVDNLITLNNLDPNNTTLTVGQTLTVPGTGAATGETPTEAATPVPAPAATQAPQTGAGTNASGQRTHTVQQGEWIYAIARLYGVEPQAIINANPALGGNPDAIYVGQVLIIP